MPTKAKRLTSTALIFILVIPLFTAIIPIPNALALMQDSDEPIQFREHKYTAGDNPFFRWINTSSSYLESTTQINLNAGGRNHVFFVMRSSLANSATFSLTYRYATSGWARLNFSVWDGSYDRTSGVDFPHENPIITKGNGLIQQINSTFIQNGDTGVINETYTLSFASSQTWVTLFIDITDIWLFGAGRVLLYNMSIIRGGTTFYFTEFEGDIMCDLAEEDMTVCSDAAWPDGVQNSSGYMTPSSGDIDIDPCIPTAFEIMNPSAKAEDGTPWVYTETKFYWFNATYINFDLEGGDEASIRFSPDGSNNVTVSYAWLNDINGLLSVSDSEDFITVPSVARNGTGASYNSTTGDLWVIFPVWFTDNSPDAQYVDVYYACTGLDYLDSGEDFHIYNKGGLVEKEVTGNASITAGGDIFEMCAYDSGTARVNITFRKIRSLTMENAVRFFDNASGLGWTPEDQYMQNATHQGGGEKASDPLDWLYTIRVYGYDNVTSSWVTLNQIRYWMIEGDEGATDEWIALFNQWSDQDGLYRSQTWNAFIEEEPAARFRLWTDLWVNKANASSVLGGRTTAYYFGMKNDGGWLLWGSWRPFLKNVTESMAFTDIKDGDGNVTQSRNYDLMKVEVILERIKTKAGEENFLVCLEDFNILEFNLEDKSVVLSGVNTPIFEESKVPDMPQTGVLTPIYAAILSLGTFIADVISGGLDALWGLIEDRFPWFTAFWSGLLAGITDLADIFVQIFGWLSQLFAWGVEFIGLIATPITIIEQGWINVVDATASFAGVAPTDLAIIFVIMFGILMPLEALQRGDASVMLKVLELTWAVARTFIFLMMRIGTFLVNAILELIPF